jgi:septum site-determining protein MinC
LANDFVTIKGRANDTLEIILSDAITYGKLRQYLLEKLNKNRAFFEGANPKVVIRARKMPKAQQEDIKKVLTMDYGLTDVKYEEYREKPPEEQPALQAVPASKEVLKMDIEGPRTPSKKLELVSSDYFDAKSIIVSHTVRSGQRIECEGDIAVLGDVNPGAELIAGGSIVVMGTLRGLAHAGATGRKDVVISAFKLCPMQLRISSKVTVFPEGEHTPAYPEIAEFKDGSIVIRPIMGKKL